MLSYLFSWRNLIDSCSNHPCAILSSPYFTSLYRNKSAIASAFHSYLLPQFIRLEILILEDGQSTSSANVPLESCFLSNDCGGPTRHAKSTSTVYMQRIIASTHTNGWVQCEPTCSHTSSNTHCWMFKWIPIDSWYRFDKKSKKKTRTTQGKVDGEFAS